LRKNILICAHEISPEQGSECAEGWNIVIELSKYHNLIVLHASGSQFNPFAYEAAIKDFFKINKNLNNIKFISVNQPFVTRILAKINKFISPKNSAIGSPLLYFLGYKFWHLFAYRAAKHIIPIYNIDLIHLLTSITFREPGYLWKFNLPYVWGPTGGLNMLPKSYKKEIKLYDSLKEDVREIISNFQFKYNNRITKLIKKCNLVYTFSEFDKICFEKRGFTKVKLLTDAGCNELSCIFDFKKISSSSLKILWVGQLIKRKALEILINSINSLDEEDKEKIKIFVVGTGPLEYHYKDMIKYLKLDKNFIFIGTLKRKILFNLMQKSDLLVHTSYREATTNVIPEALSNCLPVICHDISGMSIAINESCGFKIPLINPDFSSLQLKNILIKLINNPELIIHLKIGAKSRSISLSWNNIAKTIAKDYLKILNYNESIIN
jgi:glycosyltransferase involved in cell wall biosynthesis